VAGPVCPNEDPGELNECPGEKLEAPPAPPKPPGPFASAAEEAAARIVATAMSEKIFFMSLSLGLIDRAGFTGPRGTDEKGNGLSALRHFHIQKSDARRRMWKFRVDHSGRTSGYCGLLSIERSPTEAALLWRLQSA
jgi:hypothetical protein